MSLLYLDIDGKLPNGIHTRIVRSCEMMGWRLTAVRYDKTRRGWHVVVAVRRKLSALTIVAMQAILGSDRNRELFNLSRARKLRNVPREWRNQWNVLYETHNRNFKL